MCLLKNDEYVMRPLNGSHGSKYNSWAALAGDRSIRRYNDVYDEPLRKSRLSHTGSSIHDGVSR